MNKYNITFDDFISKWTEYINEHTNEPEETVKESLINEWEFLKEGLNNMFTTEDAIYKQCLKFVYDVEENGLNDRIINYLYDDDRPDPRTYAHFMALEQISENIREKLEEERAELIEYYVYKLEQLLKDDQYKKYDISKGEIIDNLNNFLNEWKKEV